MISNPTSRPRRRMEEREPVAPANSCGPVSAESGGPDWMERVSPFDSLGAENPYIAHRIIIPSPIMAQSPE